MDQRGRRTIFGSAGALAIAGGLLILVTIATSPSRTTASPSQSDLVDESGRPVLGELVGRRLNVRITNAEDGPRYTVLTHDGRVIKAGMQAHEVGEHFPGIDIDKLQFSPEREAVGGALMLADPGPELP